MKIYPETDPKKFTSDGKNKVNAFGLLATSLRHQTTEFFDNSTLHGVRYMAEKDRPFCEKFMWFCFTTIGTIATIIIIINLWEKFQTNPTITGLDTDFHNWDVPFPALTACDQTPVDEELIQEYIESSWSAESEEVQNTVSKLLKWLASLTYESIASDANNFASNPALANSPELKDLRNVVFNIVVRCDNLLNECEWKSDAEECCEVFFPVFTEMGYCYGFNSLHAERTWPWQSEPVEVFQEQFIHETDTKWSFVFNSNRNDSIIHLYIHATEEVVGVDMMSPQHVWDRRVEKVSFSVKHTYTTPDARQLSIKQRRCVFADEIKLEGAKIYTYSACMRQCRMRLARRYCGCVPHFYPQIEGYRYCTLKELVCIGQNVAAITNVGKCNCELSCSHSVYEVEKLTEIDLSKGDTLTPLESEFVSWPMVRYKREVLFGWVDLLVSFGGIAGLFLGFSLLSGVEIIYYFTLRAWCSAIRERDMLLTEREERRNAPKPPYNLSLVPWFIRPPESRHSNIIQVRPKGEMSDQPPQYSRRLYILNIYHEYDYLELHFI